MLASLHHCSGWDATCFDPRTGQCRGSSLSRPLMAGPRAYAGYLLLAETSREKTFEISSSSRSLHLMHSRNAQYSGCKLVLPHIVTYLQSSRCARPGHVDNICWIAIKRARQRLIALMSVSTKPSRANGLDQGRCTSAIGCHCCVLTSRKGRAETSSLGRPILEKSELQDYLSRAFGEGERT